jgi:hypothetical protein
LHHELPDILVPYKRYGSESIEAVITGKDALTVYGKESVESASHLPKSTLQKIWHHVGDAPGWLARIVRPVVNLNLWVHTRLSIPVLMDRM